MVSRQPTTLTIKQGYEEDAAKNAVNCEHIILFNVTVGVHFLKGTQYGTETVKVQMLGVSCGLWVL